MNPVERENAVRELREVLYEDAYDTIAARDDVLACRVGRGALVMADGAAAYPGAMGALGAVFERVDANSHRINRVDAPHSNR